MSVVSLFLFIRIVCSQDLNLDTASMFGGNDIQNNVVGSIVQAIMSQSNEPIQASGITVEKSEIHGICVFILFINQKHTDIRNINIYSKNGW